MFFITIADPTAVSEKQKSHVVNLQLGDKVEVNSSCQCYEDWKGTKAEVVGLFKNHKGEIFVTINNEGANYDGFKISELTKI